MGKTTIEILDRGGETPRSPSLSERPVDVDLDSRGGDGSGKNDEALPPQAPTDSKVTTREERVDLKHGYFHAFSDKIAVRKGCDFILVIGGTNLATSVNTAGQRRCGSPPFEPSVSGVARDIDVSVLFVIAPVSWVCRFLTLCCPDRCYRSSR